METRIPTFAQLAHTLRALRKDLGLTQAEAAARVGLLPKTLSKLETDPEGVSLGSLFKLLSALEAEMVIRLKSEKTVAPSRIAKPTARGKKAPLGTLVKETPPQGEW